MKIRDRIKDFRRVSASELRPNPKNWRTHPQEQLDAIKGILAEVGFAGAELARELPDGSLMLIDGHARAEIMGSNLVPVLVLDIDEAEADKLLATFDPIGAMAGADRQKLDDLLRTIDTGSEALQQMLSDLAEDAGLIDIDSANLPDLGDDSQRSFTVKYAPQEEDFLKRFLGVDELPVNKIGACVLERIKAIAAH